MIILPVYWWIHGGYSVKKKIVRKLYDASPFKKKAKCPICGGYAEIENYVLDNGKSRQKVACYTECAIKTGRHPLPKRFKNEFDAKIGFVEKAVNLKND